MYHIIVLQKRIPRDILVTSYIYSSPVGSLRPPWRLQTPECTPPFCAAQPLTTTMSVRSLRVAVRCSDSLRALCSFKGSGGLQSTGHEATRWRRAMMIKAVTLAPSRIDPEVDRG